MAGSFSIENERNTWSGQILSGEDTWGVGGEATKDMSTLYLTPPQVLLDALSADVNDQILPRIEEAEEAWEDLQAATGDYELELSLRGLRTQLPGIVDNAKAQLASGISNELADHEGEVYYNSLESHLLAADNAYYAALDNLRAQAQQATDNAQTRAAIEAALRDVAARRIFTTTYSYYITNPFGPDILVATVNVSRRIMSDSNANSLTNAADNVYRIQETSDMKISMQQIYDQVPDKQLFEQVRDDIHDGLLVIRDIGELGLTVDHAVLPPEFHLYAKIDGTRHEGGTISAMTVAAFLVELPEIMIEALKIN
jgi:F0F1-type ATP synthase membrane subunit b/b'